MPFHLLLEQFITMTGYTKKDLSAILGCHNSYITKWTSGTLLPSEHGIEILLESLSAAFAKEIFKKGETQKLQELSEANVLLNDYESIYAVTYRLLSNSYHLTKTRKTAGRPQFGGDVTKAVFGHNEVMNETFRAVIDALIQSTEELEFFVTVDLSTVKNLDLTILDNTTITRSIPVAWHFLLSEDHFPTDIYGLSNSLLPLMLQTAPHELDLHKGKVSPDSLYVICKNRFICHYGLDDNGEIISMIYTEVPDVISYFMQSATRIFRTDNLLLHKVENNDFEYMLRNGVPMPSATVMISSMFMQGLLLDDVVMDRLFERGVFSREQLQDNLALLEYYRSVLETNPVYCVVPLQAYHDFMSYGELQLGAQRIFLNYEERVLYLKHIVKTAQENENLQLRIFDLGTHKVHRKDIQYSYHSMGQLSFIKRDLTYTKPGTPIYEIVTSKFLATRINDMLMNLTDIPELAISPEVVYHHVMML